MIWHKSFGWISWRHENVCETSCQRSTCLAPPFFVFFVVFSFLCPCLETHVGMRACMQCTCKHGLICLSHRRDQTTITKTTGAATTTATTSQASALRYKCFPWRSLWNCGIKMNQTYSALFLVFGTLSANVQQPPKCLMVVNDMFSRPQRAGALEGVDPPWRKLFMKPDVNDVFHVWIVRVWFPPFFLQTSHTSPINCGINVWMSSDLNRFVIQLYYYVLFNIWEYTKQAMTLKWMTTPKPNSPSNGTASWNWRLITHSYITQRTSSRYQKFPGSRAWEIVGSIFRELKLVILHWIPLSFRELSFTPLKFCKPNTAKISINISCGFLRVFCLLLPPPRPDHDHENDRDCNNDCHNFAGIGSEIEMFPLKIFLELWNQNESNTFRSASSFRYVIRPTELKNVYILLFTRFRPFQL